MNDTNKFKSPFLEKKERLLENEVGFVIYDGYPVSKGHCLIVPHRVYSDYFESTNEEVIGLQKLVLEKIINDIQKGNTLAKEKKSKNMDTETELYFSKDDVMTFLEKRYESKSGKIYKFPKKEDK